MANAANLTSLVPTMAAIGCASELLKLVPCIQLRDKKFEILVLHSTIIRQCPQAELISYRILISIIFQYFPRLQCFKTNLELVLVRCFCSFSCRAAGLTAVALHHLLSVVWPPKKRRGFRCFKKLAVKDI